MINKDEFVDKKALEGVTLSITEKMMFTRGRLWGKVLKRKK